MKKILFLAIFLTFLISLEQVSYAQDSSVAIYLDGEKQETFGYLVNNRTILPLRDICDLLEIPVEFDAKTNKINVLINDDIYTLQLKSQEVFCNDKLIEKLDVPPEIHNGKTYLPLRYIAELLNIEVLWDNDSV